MKELKLIQERKNYSLFKKSIAKHDEVSPFISPTGLQDIVNKKKEIFLPE